MAHRAAQSSAADSSSYMTSRGRANSPPLVEGPRSRSPTPRPGSPIMASMAMMTMNTASAHGFPSLSSGSQVEEDLYHGMRGAGRQARAPKFIVQRLAVRHGEQPGLTREDISNIVASILGTAKVAAHGLLTVGIHLLEFSPIPGLASVGETLLSIWEAVEQVHANRNACKRLAEHCTVIASFVRDEVCDTTGFVPDDLKPSVIKLNKALRVADAFIKEQALQTRTYELLIRHSINRRIAEIQAHLTQTFQYFNYVIPVQIMRFLQREIHPATENHNPEIIAPPTMVIITPPPQEPQEPTVQGVPDNHRTIPAALPSIVRLDRVPGAGNLAHSGNGHATSAPTAPPQIASNKQSDMPRLYAKLVQHEFDKSLLLTMPLWTPTPVHVGAVGYYSRADGGFVTLFNARAPPDTAGIAKLSVEAFQHEPASYTGRPYKFALQAGKPAAYLYTEKTMYRCFKDLGAAGDWLLDNADKVISTYGRPGQHPVDQKRLMLVTGTMAAQDHALCVCPNAPRSNGTISFHRHKAKPGQPWGQWSQKASPDGAEPVVSKVSTVKAAREPWDTVLLSVLSYYRLMDEGAQ